MVGAAHAGFAGLFGGATTYPAVLSSGETPQHKLLDQILPVTIGGEGGRQVSERINGVSLPSHDDSPVLRPRVVSGEWSIPAIQRCRKDYGWNGEIQDWFIEGKQ